MRNYGLGWGGGLYLLMQNARDAICLRIASHPQLEILTGPLTEAMLFINVYN